MKELNVHIVWSLISDTSPAVFSKVNIRETSAFSLGTCIKQDAHMEGP